MTTIFDLKNYIDNIIDIAKQIEEYQMGENDIEELNEALLVTQLDIDIDVAEVRECENRPGDFGVFAKTNIKKGEVITLYPVDLYENTKKSNVVEHYKQHILKLSLTKIISGNPEIYSNKYCGHICNDGAKYSNIDNFDPEEYEKRSSLYIKLSKLKQNADIIILKDIVPCIIATKDIQQNSEILIHYGIARWKLF